MRSSASWSIALDPRAMKTCRITGSTSFVRSESPLLFVGTSRQPSRIWPSLAMARSISCTQAIRDAGSCGRKTMPTPYWPIAGSVRPCAPQTRRRKRSGSWIRMPAPSPCNGSAPVAPRCDRFLRIDSACVTIAWRFWPLMWAMKPSPQASCSFAGSYRPWRIGGWCCNSPDRSSTMTSPLRNGLRPPEIAALSRAFPLSGRNLHTLAAMLHCGKAWASALWRAAQQRPPDGRPPSSKRLASIAILGFNLNKVG